MARIALDAMGTDGAPRVEIEGALAAVAEGSVEVTLVGDEPRLREELAAQGGSGSKAILIQHAPEVVTGTDAPSLVVKQRKQSSMRVAFDLHKSGEAAAVVSAGNSGAMLACGLFVLGRLPGVERPAIVTAFPTHTGVCALLDMGANVDPKPNVLAQFAVLGSVYAQLLHDKKRPRVGLLSNGSEEHKGTPLTRGAHALLAPAQGRIADVAFDYIGYVEGRDIFRGVVDVVVTDGFTGNVMLKSVEGAADQIMVMTREEVMRSGLGARLGALLMRGALRRLKARTDYAERGGAPLIGVDGVAMICHGGSNAKAIKNALLVADRLAQLGLRREVTEAVARHAFLWETGAAPVSPSAREIS